MKHRLCTVLLVALLCPGLAAGLCLAAGQGESPRTPPHKLPAPNKETAQAVERVLKEDPWTPPEKLPALNEETAQAIVRVLREDKNRDLRTKACRALIQMGRSDAAAAMREELLGHVDGATRAAALRALSWLAPQRLAGLSTAPVARDPSRWVKEELLQAAAWLAPREQCAIAAATFDQPDFLLRAFALKSIGEGLQIAAERSKQSKAATRPAADKALTALLVKHVEDPAPMVRRYAAVALGRTGEPAAAPHLAKRLEDTAPDVRAAAATALGELGLKSAAPAVRKHIREVHYLVRRAAIGAAEALCDQAGIGAVQDRLVDPDYTVRRAAAKALGADGMRHDSSMKLLGQRFHDETPEVRHTAAQSLRRFPSAKALPTVLTYLPYDKEPSRHARREAAWILSQWIVPASIEPCAKALADGDWMVRMYCLRVLRVLNDRRALEHAIPRLGVPQVGMVPDPLLREKYECLIQWKFEGYTQDARIILQTFLVPPEDGFGGSEEMAIGSIRLMAATGNKTLVPLIRRVHEEMKDPGRLGRAAAEALTKLTGEKYSVFVLPPRSPRGVYFLEIIQD